MFEGYKVYKVFHKGMGRYMANLVKHRTKDRITISWAKYTYILNVGQVAEGCHVDHIDGNKLNDEVSNLQVLTLAENNRKCIIEQGRSEKTYPLLCSVCGEVFYRTKQRISRSGQCCSRRCGGIRSHITKSISI